MAIEKPLSIRDYLEPRLSAAAGGRMSVAAKKGLGSFQDLLNRQTSIDAPDQAQGMTISDYLARPVATLTATRLPRTLEPEAAPPPAKRISAAVADTGPAQRPAGEDQRAGGTRPKSGPPAVSGPIDEVIQAAADKYRLAPGLIRSVIRAESNFQADAVSPAGAQGLMQLMPETAGELGVANPFDVRQNIDGGARYLRKMLDRFGGDLKLALAAYNAGPGTVEKYGGRVPYPETQAYVARVMRFAG
jgi:soluble lytic murein transglycosylase-like protein